MLEELRKYKKDNIMLYTKKVIPGCKPCIGVKASNLKMLAKEMVKNNKFDFFNEKHELYEEDIIHAYMIGHIKDYEFVKKCLRNYVPLINNWAMCDSLVLGLKIVKKNLKDFFSFIYEYGNSNEEYELRFHLICLLAYYCSKEEYIDYIFDKLDNINNEKYYVKMAKAWLLCECMIKNRERTMDYMQKSKMDDWSYNKAIQKMIESFRISNEDKLYLKTLKRRKVV